MQQAQAEGRGAPPKDEARVMLGALGQNLALGSVRDAPSDMEHAVSVIIPTFGRHSVVREAVQSALTQTYPVHEVIVVDDGSAPKITHETIGIEDKRLKIVNLSYNSGAAAARNAGIVKSEGDIISFLDSDDLWFPDKIEIQMKYYNNYSKFNILTGIACGWNVRDSNNRRNFSRIPLSSNDYKDFISGCWFSPGSTLVVSREVFSVVGLFSENLRRLEDFEWFLRFASAGGSLISAPMIGASILKNGGARYADVRVAAEEILRNVKFVSAHLASNTVSRRLRSWLHLEMAAAARNERRWNALILHLALSFLITPRSSFHLRRWWQYGEPRSGVCRSQVG
jgi:glycosyltransferase involved in cell wall biosynthesis